MILLFAISCADKESITYQGLFDSIKDNKVLVLKAILDEGTLDINYVDEYVVTTALNEAVFYGDKEVIELVISYGADVNVKSHTGKTPLMVAASANSVELMMLLLSCGADIDALDNRDYSALMYACENGHYYACEFLFGMGINTIVTSIDNKTAFDIAKENGYDTIATLLTKVYSPLIDAVVANNNRAALQIITTDDNLDVIDSNGLTALMHATESGNMTIVRALIQSGKIDINKKDKSGSTALSLAVELGSVSMVDVLLQNGAKTDIHAIPLVFKAKTPQMLRRLVAVGVDINQVYGDFSYTPLMVAAESYTLEMVKTFVELGASTTMRNKNNRNALELAQRAGNMTVARYLSSLTNF